MIATAQPTPIRADRNSWCTPSWLTALLPFVDLDPCSNSRSTVRAHRTYSLEQGQDGLAESWAGMVWVNPPYADILPWVIKAESPLVTSVGFLVNVDPSTTWWKRLTERRHIAFTFNKRIQFTPPPGVAASTNNKPQSLICDAAFFEACDPALRALGQEWRKQ